MKFTLQIYTFPIKIAFKKAAFPIKITFEKPTFPINFRCKKPTFPLKTFLICLNRAPAFCF